MCLISVDEVARRLHDPDLRLADVRWFLVRPGGGLADYLAGHLPGAVFVDVETVLAAPPGPGRHPLPEPDWLAEQLGSLGFGSEHLVVAYDDWGGVVAARLWWMLDNLGHRRVAVLDGGIAAWTAAGLPLETEVPALPPARLVLGDRWARTIGREALRARLGAVTLLDGRAPERYRGEVEPVDPIAGHIPTALSLPVTDSVGPDGRLLPADELARRYASAEGGGDAGARETVVYCGSGVNASHHALARRVAGLPDPILYAGSYSDWTRAGFPVATGPEPGEPLGPGDRPG